MFHLNKQSICLAVCYVLFFVSIFGLTLDGNGAGFDSSRQETYRLQVTGTASENDPNASSTAKRDALAKAVEQAVGVMVKEHILSNRFQLVRKQIYSRSEGFVKSARPVGQPEISGNVYMQTWDVVVASGEINKELVANGIDVEFLYDSVLRPRICIAVIDQWKDKPDKPFQPDFSSSVQSITRFFKEKHPDFIVKDLVMLSNSLSEQPDYVKLARKNRFDILILGATRSMPRSIKSAKSDNPWVIRNDDPLWDGKKYSFNVMAEWRIINTATAEVIGTVSEHYVTPDGSGGKDAYELETSKLWAKKQLYAKLNPVLFQTILAHWNRSVFQEGYEVVFTGFTGQSVLDLKQVLRKTQGIARDSIHLIGSSDGTVEFSIKTDNASRSEIVTGIKNQLGPGFVIDTISSGKITISSVSTQSQSLGKIYPLTIKYISLSESKKLITFLSGEPGIRSVQLQGFSDSKVKFTIKTENTTDVLGELVESYRPGHVIVTDLDESHISATWKN